MKRRNVVPLLCAIPSATPPDTVLDGLAEIATMALMTPRLLGSLAVLVLLGGTVSRADEPAPTKGFRAIINGKDHTGWYGWNPHTSAKLEGEILAASLKELGPNPLKA